MAPKRSPEELVRTFDAVAPTGPGVVKKQMFGFPACIFQGHLFFSLFQSEVIVRLSDTDSASAISLGAKPFEPMPGKAMTGFLSLPDAIVSDERTLRAFVACALAHAKSMPPKPETSTKKAAAKKPPSPKKK